MGTVFILNAVALYLFPVVGPLRCTSARRSSAPGRAWPSMTSVQRRRRGLALRLERPANGHGGQALAGPVDHPGRVRGRLRVLSPGTDGRYEHRRCRIRRRKPKVAVPWFVGFFLLASVLRSYVPGVAHAAPPVLSHAATLGLTLTLFLIGAGLSMPGRCAQVGWRPLLQGVAALGLHQRRLARASSCDSFKFPVPTPTSKTNA